MAAIRIVEEFIGGASRGVVMLLNVALRLSCLNLELLLVGEDYLTIGCRCRLL